MKRIIVVVILLIPALDTLAQQATPPTYTPAVPAPASSSMYGGYWDTGASTLEEGAMRGMASVISAKGDYNLSTSAATVNLTQAQKQYIENRQTATQTYFDMQEINRSARVAKKSQQLSQEQLVRIAAEAAPKKLGSNEIDFVSGQIHWPALLQKEEFANERAALEKLSLKRAQYGSLGASDRDAAGQLVSTMSVKLKELVKTASAQQYVASKNFLKSLMYAVTGTVLT
jgi:hypothetical protein